MNQSLFRSFFIGGIECSSHVLKSGKRLDMIAATGHDKFYRQDYRRLKEQEICTIRSGIRWHLIEQGAGYYDFSSVLPALQAAHEMRMEVIWDLCHYGIPDDIDIFKPEFIDRFSKMVQAFAHLVANETDITPFFCPINEISFFAWGGGDVAYLNPFTNGRGFELKVQLARASIAAIEAIWRELPQARIVHVDPLINVVADLDRPEDIPTAEEWRLAQYQGWDLLSGRLCPQIGGDSKYLDILGLNYYHDCQWIWGGKAINRLHPQYRPLYHMIREVQERYERPMFIAETGMEDDARPVWLRYIMSEVDALAQAGIQLEGICLYPILCHPAWDDERHCQNGLWGYPDENGNREIYQPLADELAYQQRTFPTLVLHYERKIEKHRRLVREKSIKPNLCLFTDSLEPSGMGEHMLTLAYVLQESYQIYLICPSSPYGDFLLERAEQMGINTCALEVRGQSRETWEHLRDYLCENMIDIMHIHAETSSEGHHAVDAAYAAQVPVVLRTEHLPYLLTKPEDQANYRAMLDKVHGIVVVSDSSRHTYEANGIPEHRLHTIHNGIFPMESNGKHNGSSHHHVCAMLNLPANARILLTVARLNEQKGHRHLLETVPSVVQAYPDTYFVWAGEGPLESEFRAMVEADECLRKHVLLLGQRDDVNDLLHAAHAFILPSIFEGLPVALLEAMSAHVPIIATHVGGVPEVIKDGVHGRLVPSKNPVALQRAILEVLGGSAPIAEWQANAYRRFEIFSVIGMADKTHSLYQDLLEQSCGQPVALEV